MSLFGEYASGYLLWSLLGGVVPLGLLVLAIIAVVTSRGEADPQGRRPMAIYLAGVLFVALFVAIFAVFSAVDGVSQAVGDDDGRVYNYDSEVLELGDGYLDEEYLENGGAPFGFELEGDDERTTRAVGDGLEALLVALPAAGLFAWHLRLRQGLLDEDGFPGSPAARIDRAFLHATASTSVLLAVVGLANVLPDLLALAAPGLTDPGATSSTIRDDALRSLFPYLTLTLLTGASFVWAWRQTPDGTDFLRSHSDDRDEDGEGETEVPGDGEPSP